MAFHGGVEARRSPKEAGINASAGAERGGADAAEADGK